MLVPNKTDSPLTGLMSLQEIHLKTQDIKRAGPYLVVSQRFLMQQTIHFLKDLSNIYG